MCLGGAFRPGSVSLHCILLSLGHPAFLLQLCTWCVGIYAFMSKKAWWSCSLVSWESGVKVSRGERQPAQRDSAFDHRGDLSWSDSSALLWTRFKPACHLQYSTLVVCVCAADIQYIIVIVIIVMGPRKMWEECDLEILYFRQLIQNFVKFFLCDYCG